MALELNSLLDSVTAKIGRIEELNRGLQLQIEQLKAENETLRRDLANTVSELETEKRNAEYLTMSHRLADSPDSLVSTRHHIARLIRTIDNCISMLKEE